VAVMSGDYAWVFDLIAVDDRVRRHALSRHQALLSAAGDALHRSNRIPFLSTKPHRIAQRDQALADMCWHLDQTLEGKLEAFYEADPEDVAETSRWAPFAVLSLRWEASFPAEWRAPESWMSSPWNAKERLLRRLERGGIPQVARADVVDLIVAALLRPYRCKDWMFAGLAHHFGDDLYFWDRIQALVAGGDAVTRERARFVAHAARHPEMVITRTSWGRWLEADATPGSYAG
jgi:hypothetical protein